MNAPTDMNMAPVSLSDVAALLDAKTEKTLSRINETLARIDENDTRRDAAAAQREADLRADIAKRDADLQESMNNLRSDMQKRDTDAAQRETRQLRWFGGIVVGAVVALGVYDTLLELRTARLIQPPLSYQTAPATPPLAAPSVAPLPPQAPGEQ